MLTRYNKVTDCSLLMDSKKLHVPDHRTMMDICSRMNLSETDNVKFSKEKSLAFNQVSGHEEEMQTLKYIMKALGITMAAFGIYHFENLDGNEQKEDQCKNRPKTVFGVVHSIYCCIIMFLFCGYFIRSVSAFFVGEEASDNFTFRIIVATWSLQITVNVFIMMKASHPGLGYSELVCKTWDSKVLPLMNHLDVKLDMNRIRTIVSAIVFAGWSAIALNICLIPVILFKKDSNFSDAMANTLIAPLPVNFYTKLFVCVFTAFETVAWIVPVMYLMALCFIVQSAFKVCSLALRNTVENGRETNTYTKCLYRQRMLHLNISKCLDLMDKDFQYLFANMFFTNIPLACFILYHMLKTDTSTMNTTVLTFWLVTNIMFVTMATLSGATVNTVTIKMDLHKLAYPDYIYFNDRLVSYSLWLPQMTQSKQLLTHAGLFYGDVSAQVKCFACGIRLWGWREDDDPWLEHYKHQKNCVYMKMVGGVRLNAHCDTPAMSTKPRDAWKIASEDLQTDMTKD